MNGATALVCENTIKRPNSTKTITIGTSQYFFSCRRNWNSSTSTRDLAMDPSEHPFEMPRVVIPVGIRCPAGVRAARTRHRIAAASAHQHADRRQHEEKDNRQQDARVNPPKNRR